MKNEFRVQFENENGKALFVLFQTADSNRAREFEKDLNALNDKFSTSHDIAIREFEYHDCGEWVQVN